MKKGLIALAVASAFVAPAAMADTSNVNVYGTVDMTFGNVNYGTTSSNQVASNVTKFGIKGSEDLGDGMSVVWQIEQQIDIDNTSATAGATNPSGAGKNTLASRNSFAGLKGESWGTVLMGTHDTPYKIATRGLDAFADELPDNRAIMGAAGAHDARLGNVLAYISPSWGGFTVAAAYVAAAELAPNVAASSKASVYSLAGMYNNGPINVDAAYQSLKYGTAATGSVATAAAPFGVGDTNTAWKIGGSYTFFDALKLNAVYENIKSSGATVGNAFSRKNWYLAGIYSFGNDAVKVAYTRGGDVGGVANTGAKQWSLGYDHNMSKRTKIYGVYTRVSNNSATKGFVISSAGSTAGGLNPAANVNGMTQSGWGIGLKHTF